MSQSNEVTHLRMLAIESTRLIQDSKKPNKDWYQERIVKIFEYSGLDWTDLTTRYKNNDVFLSEKAAKIQEGLAYIISDWSTQPVFDLSVYHIVIFEINELWTYYENNYIDENHDSDISDLISGLKNL
jgi:hypothetical protein